MDNKEELLKFKHLTEYFVAHLEYLANGSQSTSVGCQKYIMPWINKKSFKSSGQGWNNQSIQKQIGEWDQYSNGQICINVYGANYQSRGTYLNWKGTGANIMAEWNGNHVSSLVLVSYDPDLEEWTPMGVKYTIEELNMFDGQLPNERYQSLFYNYNQMLEAINNNKRMHVLDKYLQLLRTNKNLILTGAPGTGKTYMAKEIAKAMGCTDEEIGFVQFHPSYDYTDFVEGLRPVKDESGNVGFERKDGTFKMFCKQALQAYLPVEDKRLEHKITFDEAYDRFIDDLKISKKVLEFDRVRSSSFEVSVGDDSKLRIDGTPINKELVRSFYKRTNSSNWYSKHCEQIIDYLVKHYDLDSVFLLSRFNPDSMQKCVFIIDEINRGEISKIFGELFFSIDPGYRGEAGKVQTQYQNIIDDDDVFKEGFYVPENVYIIGTMNDIDRSVESMDFAMRRRFAWQEVTAAESYANMIENDAQFAPVKDEIKARMFSLNQAIVETEGLDEAYQIGAAYFRKYLDYQDRENPFECLWENHLKGLLFEYLRGNRRAKELLEHLHKAYNKISTDEQSADTNEG